LIRAKLAAAKTNKEFEILIAEFTKWDHFNLKKV
jgi:hypothetical protein